MCKYLCWTSAAMLAVLMTVDAFAAPPKGGHGRTGPTPGPAVNRPANPAPHVASNAVGDPHRETGPNRSGNFTQPQPITRNTHPTPTYPPHAANFPGPRPGYNPKPFTPAWYAYHPRAWWATHPYRPYGVVTWFGLSKWVGLDTAPVYYDYGFDGSEQIIVYNDDNQDANNPFTDQTTTDEQTGQTDAEWFPLGMYSLIPPGYTDGIAVFQLAIGKDGAIRGTYHDVLTDAVYPLKGSWNKNNQKVSWHLDANKAIVYETGLHNLTEPKTAIVVRFGDQKKQKWTMERMNFEEYEQK